MSRMYGERVSLNSWIARSDDGIPNIHEVGPVIDGQQDIVTTHTRDMGLKISSGIVDRRLSERAPQILHRLKPDCSRTMVVSEKRSAVVSCNSMHDGAAYVDTPRRRRTVGWSACCSGSRGRCAALQGRSGSGELLGT